MLWCYWTSDTDSLALGTITGVKDIFGGIPTLLSISVSENAQSPVYQYISKYM